MPPVAAIISTVVAGATAAVTAAAVAVGAAIGGITAAVGAAGVFGQVALSVGLSLVASLLTRSDTPRQVKPDSITRNVRESIGYRRKIYGRTQAGGQILLHRQEVNSGVVGGSPNNTMFLLIAVCDGITDSIDEYFIDNTSVTIGANNITTSGSGQGSSKILRKLGLPNQTAFDDLVDTFDDIDESWVGEGTTLLLFEAAADTSNAFELFPSGSNTQISCVGNFKRIPDPLSLGQGNSFSANAARVIYDHLTASETENGLRYPLDLIDMESFQEATEHSDVVVAAPLGGTRNQWELHGAVDYSERPIDALSRMLRSCNGQLSYNYEGKIGLNLGSQWKEPEIIITDDMIFTIESDIGQYENESGNVIKASYLSPPHGYVEQDAIEYIHSSSITEGRKIKEIDYTMSADHGQTRHLQKIESAKLNSPRRITVSANVEALNLLFSRYVRITSILNDINSTFEVQPSPQELIDNKFRIFGVRAELIELTEDDIIYNELTDGVDPPVVPMEQEDTSKPEIPVISVSTVPGGIRIQASNANANNLHVVRFSRRISEIPLEFDIPQSTNFAQNNLITTVTGLSSGFVYRFEVQAISSGGRSSEYSLPSDIAFVSNPNAPDPVLNVSASTTSGNIDTTFTMPNDPTVNNGGARLYGSQTDDSATAAILDTKFITANTLFTCSEINILPGDYYRWVASFNESGVEALRIPTGIITVT